MSWNGTVRCSVCYKKGHNKSGCPQVLQEYNEYKDLITETKLENFNQYNLIFKHKNLSRKDFTFFFEI